MDRLIWTGWYGHWIGWYGQADMDRLKWRNLAVLKMSNDIYCQKMRHLICITYKSIEVEIKNVTPFSIQRHFCQKTWQRASWRTMRYCDCQRLGTWLWGDSCQKVISYFTLYNFIRLKISALSQNITPWIRRCDNDHANELWRTDEKSDSLMRRRFAYTKLRMSIIRQNV